MEQQIKNFDWAQDKINALTASNQQERREAQLAVETRWPSENRKQRRERERQERRAAKKVKA
jgi:hypothetical protein